MRAALTTRTGLPPTTRPNGTLKTAAMAVCAPFLGLAFVVGLPLAGLALLATWAARAALHDERARRRARDVALFFAAPFVGLAYVVAMPFAGLAMLAWVAGKALARSTVLRRVGLAAAAPFVGLAFVAARPLAGLATLVAVEWRALRTPAASAC